MSINSISQRPVAFSSAASQIPTPAAQATQPAAPMGPMGMVDNKMGRLAHEALPRDQFDVGGLDSPGASFKKFVGPGPMQRPDALQNLKLPVELSPQSAQNRVQDVAREALTGKLDDLSNKLSTRAMIQSTHTMSVKPDLGLSDRVTPRQVDNAARNVLADVRQQLQEGGVENLAWADKALDKVADLTDSNSNVSPQNAVKQLKQLDKSQPALESSPESVKPSLRELLDIRTSPLMIKPDPELRPSQDLKNFANDLPF
ncbi:hypothetical protein [Archangium primigenium]|uniref:hypothetical protein n=1 Tax=[Archangium] primigenium TaxID=2792470 RepID=UPI00195B7D35|nr:hypothetical protein [Archangium primigenium]MBM7114319.1 hypothetical protein [Archangium primigenium]